VMDLASRVAKRDSAVLITGESGTGKELIAGFIHRGSPRRESRFVPVNCAAISPNLVESELFGHEKGAFTSANTAKVGLCEIADGGTLFLDEITHMSAAMQVKLLRFVEDHSFMRLGGTKPVTVDVRIIAASNQPLEEMVASGQFREDLYYRLAVITIHVPPLRERPQDIEALCRNLLHKLTDGAYVELPPGQVEVLERYRWPGNVRELRNVLERALILSSGKEPDPAALIESSIVKIAAPEPAAQRPIRPLDEIEREHIERALVICEDNKTRAAKMLSISLSTLRRRLAEYNDSNPA
ncbi:sigma-54-dependent Fis family transcriptional regulator, partial [bacterium]|nr:sigma-54-dependent Fis family transcriptional regulator [bacterium]